MNSIIKKLKSDKKILSKAYKNHIKDPTSGFEWLTDNFYIIEKIYDSALKEALKLKIDTDTTALTNLCDKICENGVLPCDEKIIALLLKENLTIKELENIALFIKATLLSIAADTVDKDEDVFSSCVQSLIRIAETDFGKILYETSVTEKLLCQDPAGIYRNMDEQTKSMYRESVYKTAIKTKRSEAEICVEILEKAKAVNRHIGFYLDFPKPDTKMGILALTLEAVLPLAAGIILSAILKAWYLLPVLYLPLWEGLKFITDFINSKAAKPKQLMSMDFSHSIPLSEKTVIAVSILLPDAASSKNMTEHLRHLYLSNCKDNVYICVLADLRQSKTPTTPTDKDDINAMKRVIDSLNEKYNGKFILAIRDRRFSITENAYIAHERKRGAVTSLVKLIKEDNHDFSVLHGDTKQLTNAKYIMALDSDTEMPAGSLNALIGIGAHPLNSPVISPSKNRVTRGFGIISPRMETSLNAASRTHFSSAFAGSGGLPAYTNTVCERYQDMFGTSIFSGKGLINVDAYYRLLPDRFPQEQILSHDILEGIILRTGFAGEIALTDSFPTNEHSYFKRLHRWIRGDIQNIQIALDRRYKQTFNALDKWWLSDNIRRALTPTMSVIAIILSFIMPSSAATAATLTALLSLSAVHLFSMIRSLIHGEIAIVSRLYFSDTVPYSMSCLFKALINAITLVRHAQCAVDAILRSLHRMLISRKHMLEWTTAADAEKEKSFFSLIKKSIISFTLGLLLLIFGNTAMKIAGLLFIFDLPFAVFSGKQKKVHKPHLNESEKKQLLSYTSLMWRFYEDLCNKEHNYLIPDNIQFSPVFAVADRTSPTNIGLMLCAFLAARDFDYIGTQELYLMLSRSLNTIEKLEKYKGNLYNWYSTKTLDVLTPRFISTVDSGNFLCCLTALKQGLVQYTNECPELESIREHIDSIINGCDMDFLYSKKRDLFHIGYDTQSQTLASSYFDLLMSEARMTSYFAVASDKVPLNHWKSLGRTLSKSGRYTGPVSWSGTMFEYFMPALFLPDFPNTISREGLKFCIYCQKKQVKNMNIPYGISESGYYAFDVNLNYSYKAHGTDGLSIRKSNKNETVISPYSSFLTISQDPHGAMKNLKELKDLGVFGKYGFCEAVDFTKKRCRNRNYSVVRSYMSHHIGMSFIAAANAVFENTFRKRFISDDSMLAKESLLMEKIPSDAKIGKNPANNYNTYRPERTQRAKTNLENVCATNPVCAMYSNGEWSLFAADTGCSISLFREMSVFKCRKDPFCYPDGIFAAIKYNEDSILPFTDAPTYGKNPNIAVQISDTGIVYKNSDKNFSCTQSITVHPKLPCQIQTFRIKNKTKSKKSISLMIYAEPFLKKIEEPDTHPAFSNMFIEVFYDEAEKVLIFTRKTDCKDNQLYITMGFSEKSELTVATDREGVLSPTTGIFGIFENNFNIKSESVDKCIALQLNFNVSAFSVHSQTLLIAAASNKTEAVNSIVSLRRSVLPSESKCAPSVFTQNSVEEIYAKKLCERYLFGRSLSSESKKAAAINEGSRKDLWETGISGDFPIVLVRCEKDSTQIPAFIAMHSGLRQASIKTELVFITDSPLGYNNKIKDAVMAETPDSEIIGKRGGIFIMSTLGMSRNALSALSCAATVIYPETETPSENEKFVLSPLKASIHNADKNMFIKNGYLVGKETYLPWCHVISNRNFGVLLSNTSLGYTWAFNSRENKLTPWYNDTRRVFGGEMLIMSTENGRFDLINGSCAFFKNGTGEYYAQADAFSVRTGVNVQGENLCKKIELTVTNTLETPKDIEISYYCELALGDFPQKQLFIKKETGADRIILKNIYNNVFDGYTVISGDRECKFSFDKTAFLANKSSENDTHNCVIATRKLHLPGKSSTDIKFYLSYGSSIFSAVKMPYIAPKNTNTNRIIIETEDKSLNHLFNDFLPNQIIDGRIFARTGFYQCSGAFGFRDQLQDAMAVAVTHPEILKLQILRCCGAQFREGDVLHWFHQLYTGGKRIMRGVRTLYSDDLLWLPLAVSEYCTVSGDFSLLDVNVPFIDAPVLQNGEIERYGEFTKSKYTASVYSHCITAISHACRFGSHSLPLIKGGDWNDSFNKVGIKGKGESVWLGMFLSYVLKKFAFICNYKGDKKTKETMKMLAVKILNAVDEHAWDTNRYLRCFYDDGTPMGKIGNSECETDLLPQAWSVISDMPNKERCKTAINTAYEQLVDKENGIIKLFTPAFNDKSKTAGYVNRYPEGVRENGGQYTHGAVWLADAFFRLNEPQKGYELLNILNPAKKNTDIYKTEPYYLAGDVYSKSSMTGRGGWSIYSGSAGWFYRTVSEQMFGISKSGKNIKINPRLPEELRESRVKIQSDGHTHEFRL